MEILKLASIEVEPLTDFAEYFEISVNENLNNVWLGHKDTLKMEEVKKPGLIYHADWNITSNAKLPEYSNEGKPFEPQKILEGIVKTFKTDKLVSYIFYDCYVLIRWDNGSFEPVFASDLNTRITAVMKSMQRMKRPCPFNVPEEKNVPKKRCVRSPDVFEADELAFLKPQRKLIKLAKVCEVVVPKEELYPRETVTLDPILYDWKQRCQMPIASSAEQILMKIIRVPLSIPIPMLDEWFGTSAKWSHIRKILQIFVEKESVLAKNNGYQRVLKTHLNGMAENSGGVKGLKPIGKERVMAFICDILRRVIPLELFGNSKRLRKNFFTSVNQLMCGLKHQAFSLQIFLDCFEPYPKWRLQMAPIFQRLMTIKLVKFLVTEYIMVILKNYFYLTECGSSGFELFYYKKSDVESMSVRKVNSLLKCGRLVEVIDEEECLERNWLENKPLPDENIQIVPEDMMSIDCEYQLPAAKVRFLPKSSESGSCRPITIIRKTKRSPGCWKIFTKRHVKRQETMARVKRFLDCIYSSVGTGIQPVHSNPQLANAWKKVIHLKETSGGKLYFVKADIAEAFDSVNHNRLFHLLDLFCPDSGHHWAELVLREWVIRRGRLMNVTRQSFSRKLLQNRLLFSRQVEKDGRHSPAHLKEVIRQVVGLQRLRIGHKVYSMTAGLCQGGAGPLSTRLCDLYYSALDLTYFRPLTNDGKAILVRGTDDYFFVTSDREKAVKFHSIVLGDIPKYGTSFNKQKLVTNIFEECPPFFTYLGLIFNVDTLVVQPNYEKYELGSMLNHMKLSFGTVDPRLKKTDFLIQRSLKLNVLKFVPIVLKSHYSDVEFTRQVIVNGCSIQTKRILALALYLRPSTVLLTRVLTKVAKKISRTIENLTSLLSAWEISYIFWQCAYGSFYKHSGNLPGLLKRVQLKLTQCCCRLRSKKIFDGIQGDVMDAFKRGSVQWWRHSK